MVNIKVIVLRILTNVLAPLFYICVAEMEKLKKIKTYVSTRNGVYPVTDW